MKKNKFKLNDGGDPGKPKGVQYRNFKPVKLGDIEFDPNTAREGNEGEYLIVKDTKTGKDYGVVKEGNKWRYKNFQKDTPIGRMQNVYNQKELEIKSDLPRKTQLIYDSKDYITLTKGKDKNLKVPKAVIDSAIVSSKKVDVDPNKLLGLMSRESSYGVAAVGFDKENQALNQVNTLSKKDSYVSAWHYNNNLRYPKNPQTFLSQKGAEGLGVNKTSRGYYPYIKDKKQLYNYLKENPNLEKEYVETTNNFKDRYEGDALAWAAETIDKNPNSYNPGDPKYKQMLQQDINNVKSDPNLQSYIKKRTSQLKYNKGGKVGFEDVAGLASAFVNPISAIPSALNLIGKLAYNPASYTPAKMNESPMGYAYGGDMEQALQIMGGNDQQMGDHAVQVEGNPGVDTNYRNIGGQDVALTQGEIVRQDQDGSAYVWSNNPKMKHPSGTTFAKAMKPIENKIARLKSRVEKDHTDVYASNALGHLEQMVEQNKNIEETMRQKKGSPTAQRFNKGGYIKANGGYDQTPTDPLISLGQNMYPTRWQEGIPALLKNKVTNYINSPKIESDIAHTKWVAKETGSDNKSYIDYAEPNDALDSYKIARDPNWTVSPKIASPSQRVSNSPFNGTPQNFLKANPSHLTPVTGKGLPKTESLSTFEDKAFLGAKSLETAFRVGAALDKPMQYDTRRYNVDRIRYSPQRALDANQANYQGAQYDINTGNANTDRILRNNLYGQKMAADRDVIGKNDQMQNQSDLQVNQYNAQAKVNVDNINEKIRGVDYQATDAALTSIGNLSSIFQQAGGAKAHNRITMSTLNSLSRRYGIDVPELMALMQGEGDLNKGTVKYKGK